MRTHDVEGLLDSVMQGNEPVFKEPWEAQAFAMAVNLHQQGAFTWAEWAQALSGEIHSGIERDYYLHWLSALEKIVAQKSLAEPETLLEHQHTWHRAAAATPHGEPIVFSAGLDD